MKKDNIQLNRQEFKYYVTDDRLSILRQSLKEVMKVDDNALGSSSTYTITSIYFDTPFEEDFEEKVDGVKSREKFRIRTYNKNYNLIKFESKKRSETVIKKTSAIISQEDTVQLCNGDYSPLLDSDDDFLKLSYSKLTSEGYRPIVVVEYDREAYFLPYGNIRITFDKNLRTYNSDTNFLNLTTPSIPVFQENLQILEVKHSIPLPAHLRFILSKTIASRNSISKFILAQKYNEKSQYRDLIQEPF
jgi:hypothetical protein